jgi:pyrimidine deaminase RibD-like protein
VGREVRVNTRYHQSGDRPGPNNQFYIVEPDASLDGDNDGDEGLEFVSPPMPIDELLKDLNAVKAWAGRMGVYTNSSTGLHINISVPNYSVDRLDYVKLALLLGDEYVLNQFGRSSNTYTKSALGKVRDRVRSNPEDAQRLLDKMKGQMGDLASKAIHSGSTDKYTSINTKDGHIEFRSPGGDWLDDNFDKIENTLLRFTVAMSAALNPEAYREEYQKKLYKLLTQDQKGSDTIRYFADYVAGKIPKAALRSFVKQAQLQRKTERDKTSGEKMWWNVSNPGNSYASVEVVATSREEAIEKALGDDGYPSWANTRQSIVAEPVRPYNLDAQSTQDDDTASAFTAPPGPGRPNDPNGRYAIVPRSDPVLYGQSRGVTPDYQFRFNMGNPAEQAQGRYVLQAWAARNNVVAADYMVVDTEQWDQPADAAAGGIIDIEPDVAQALPGSTADLAQQRATPGTFSGAWKVLVNGEEVHRFSGVGNNQSDANRVAATWLRNNGRGVSGEGFEVYPIMTEGVVEAFDQPYKTKTEKSDYGDVDMLARLPDGTNLSIMFNKQENNDGEETIQVEFYRNNSQEVTGEGDAQKIFATVLTSIQKYIKKYKPARLSFSASKATDPTIYYEPDQPQPNPESRAKLYDRLVQRYARAWGYRAFRADAGDLVIYELSRLQSAVAESASDYELHDRPKLDRVLAKCCRMVVQGQQRDPERYGQVAACVIDPDNRMIYGINLPGKDGTRRHAERVAIDKYRKSIGEIPQGSIVVTTCSPCNSPMEERHGESCKDLLNSVGIHKVYAGYQDPTQHDDRDADFRVYVTENDQLWGECQLFAQTFLGSEELAEAFNQPYKTKSEKGEYGIAADLVTLPDGSKLTIIFNRKNAENDTWSVEFWRNNNQRITGQGDAQRVFATVLTAIQKFIKENKPQKLFFDANTEFGESRAKLYDRLVQRYTRAWGYRAFRADYRGDMVRYELSRLQPVAENFADGIMKANEFIVESDERAIAQAQYMQGECAVLAITIHKMDPQRFPLGFVYEFFDSMPDIYIEPDEFDELDPARQQDIQYNHQNWSLTHAYVYDVKTQKYIDARGSHDSPPNIGHDFNATRHNKFPAKIQDLVNVSSYMEWDEAQEKWIVLRGWDALNKAYTPEDQQRAREYAIKYLGVGDSGGKSIENENFADGRNPQDKGDSKRHGVPTKASVSTLRKVAKQGGRKGQLAHWMANMKAGRARAKRNK